LLHWAGAITHDGSTEIQTYDAQSDANTGSALESIIRNVKDKKFFVGVADDLSIGEYHENIPPRVETQRCCFSPDPALIWIKLIRIRA